MNAEYNNNNSVFNIDNDSRNDKYNSNNISNST